MNGRYGRILLPVVCALLFGVLAGCTASKAPEAAEPETEKRTETKTEAVPAEEDVPDFTIVRGDTSGKAVTDAAVALRNELEAMGLTVDIKTDWVKRGEEMIRFPNELLIGETNRPESEALYARMDGAEEPYDYIVTVGAENCIAATDDAVGEAAAVFAGEYARLLAQGGASGAGTREFERKHEFARRLVIGGTEFVRARCESGKSDPEKYAASELMKYLKKLGFYEGDGALFRLSIDIRIPRDSYEITPGEDGSVAIAGGNGRGVIYGVYAFLERYAGARFFMPGLETLGEGDVVVDEAYSHTMIFEMRHRQFRRARRAA